jgi:RimJ/RimL family protein N-acetyltransferase
MKKRVLVGSIFASANEYQSKLLELQLYFLGMTTESFDHVAVVNDTKDIKKFNTKVIDAEVIKKSTGNHPIPTECHISGLRKLLKYFKENVDNYDYFLFLDSDAFPIRENWDLEQAKLLKNYGKKMSMAIRYENLEQRLHSSVLFITGKNLDILSFDVSNKGLNLFGNTERDIRPVRFDKELLSITFPLIRSNRVNYHPLWCGVYFDSFYHHQCGTPLPQGRTMNGDAYWGGMTKNIKHDELTQQLINDPINFIRPLVGWEKDFYPVSTPIYSMWESDNLKFVKVSQNDLRDLLKLKMESWQSCHTTCFLNEADQKRWIDNINVVNPKDMIMMVYENDVKVGSLKVNSIDWLSGSAMIGWNVFEEHREKGIGKRLVKTGVEFAIKVMNLRHLSAEILSFNEPSIKCALNAGMKEVGRRSNFVFRDGKYVDSIIFEKVRD